MGLLEILGLNLGNLNVSASLDQRSASWNNAVLNRRAPTVLPRHENAAGLHHSVVVAREIAESVQVPTSELEDILEKLKDLENQVEGLLGDDEDAVEVNTTTENVQDVDAGVSDEEPTPAAEDDEGEEADGSPKESGASSDDANDESDSSNGFDNSPAGAVFKEKVQVETEVVTSTMEDSTSTTTMTRTKTETVTVTPDVAVESSTAAPAESVSEPVVISSDLSASDNPSASIAQPTPNVRLGAAFKEAGQPFSASNATAVAVNVAQPSRIPGDVVSASTTPTPMPMPAAVKQFNKVMFTNTSASTGFQTVTLPSAQ